MSRVLVHAVIPTARAVSWTPLVAATAGLLALALIVRSQQAVSPEILSLGVGATAAAIVYALRDPAAALLAAVPVSNLGRGLLRLGLAAAVALPLWLLVTAVLPGARTEVASLAALVAAGLAISSWLPEGRGVTLAAGAPLLWVAAGELFSDLDGPVHTVLRAWSSHPIPVAVIGLLLFMLGGRR